VFANLAASYLLGLATPLTAVCVLPLYPGFIAFLSNRRQEGDQRSPLLLGLAAVAGYWPPSRRCGTWNTAIR
jgi:cytochrome c-type biogenesis protein